MTRSQVVLASIATLASFHLVAPLASVVVAQDAPDTTMAQYQFSGVLNADNVYVRSGASENDYPVIKLSKGDGVVVVGMKYDWLKILPPDNTFCLVGKVWVDKRGDGTIGRVRDDATNVNVRVGSSLNSGMISKVAIQLKSGDDVKILGEQDEYFKIAPPAGTFVFVHKKFVDVIKSVEVVNINGKLEVKQHDAGTGTAVAPAPGAVAENTAIKPADTATPPADMTMAAGAPATAPSAAATVTPTASAAAEADFDALEAKFTAASKQPIDQQPIDELLTGYKKITDEKQVPESMLRMAEFRLKGLQIRKEALADFVATQKMREELVQKQKPMQAESQEIAARIAENQVKRYTAVGTLRTSALTYGGKTLYRLTDPATERTVVYVMTSDPEITRLQGLFVAIKGDVTDDTVRKIKFVEPKQFETIDPTLIARGTATSAMTPASLVPTSTTSAQ